MGWKQFWETTRAYLAHQEPRVVASDGVLKWDGGEYLMDGEAITEMDRLLGEAQEEVWKTAAEIMRKHGNESVSIEDVQDAYILHFTIAPIGIEKQA